MNLAFMYGTTNLSLTNNYVSTIVYAHAKILIITEQVYIKVNLKQLRQVVLFVI